MTPFEEKKCISRCIRITNSFGLTDLLEWKTYLFELFYEISLEIFNLGVIYLLVDMLFYG